jgi:uncharacterized membrane protein/mono/diheme cytochrome c family protein
MFRPTTLRLLLVALLAAGPAAAAAQGPSSEPADPWWGWVLLGRTHPFIVHFPIGLLLAGAAVEIARRLRGRRVPSDVGLFCLTAGLAGGALAVWLGTLNAGHQSITGESAQILSRHQVAGWTVLAVGVVTWIAARAARSGAAWAAPAYLGLFLATGAAVGATGHYGGQLVYGSTYVTSVLPWNRKPAPAVAQATAPSPEALTPPADEPPTSPPASTEPVEPSRPAASEPDGDTRAAANLEGERPMNDPAGLPSRRQLDPTSGPAEEPASRPAVAPASESADPPARGQADVASQESGAPTSEQPHAQAVSFARDVMPLIRTTCVECHGPDKVKGRLRMDSVEALKAGGKSGPLFRPGDPEQSLIMRRVLGLDGEDQMPLDADPLTPEQIEILRRWIADGARFDTASDASAEATRPQG